MKLACLLSAAILIALAAAVLSAPAAPPATAPAATGPAPSAGPGGPGERPWWQRPADAWYYKDDWQALAITAIKGPAVVKTIAVASGSGIGRPLSAYILIWGDRGYRLHINGKLIGQSVDGGLIDDYDLTSLVRQTAQITIRIEGRRVAAEGEIVDCDGKAHPFLTGEDWQGADGGGVRAQKMVAGPSVGAFHRAHNAPLIVHRGQQTKARIAKCLGRLQKLQEQSEFQMRRLRPAGDILSLWEFQPALLAEEAAEGPAALASHELRSRAIPAQEAGNSEAGAAATNAAWHIAAAEAPVAAATDVYLAERQALHLANVAALLGKQGEAIAADLPDLNRLAASARQAQEDRDWASAGKAARRLDLLARGVRERTESASTAAGRPLVGGVGELDEFPEDRFAWLNARKLMGNDPADWPFTMLPSSDGRIDLAGQWDFRTDPNNVGEKEGWHTGGLGKPWRRIYAPLEWERQGVTEDNRRAPGAPIGKGVTGRDKPYNGFAWYRKDVFIPEAWRGRKVQLIVGRVGQWARVFVNGKAGPTIQAEGEGRRLVPPTLAPLPAEAFAFGKTNTIAVQVYNADNFGGLVGGPLAIRAGDEEAPGPGGSRQVFRETRETPGPLSFTQEYVYYPDEDTTLKQTFLASAMSPGVLVATDKPELELWGWHAKGFLYPEEALLPTAEGVKTVRLDKAADLLPAGGLSDKWLALRGGPTTVVIVFDNKPRGIEWKQNAQGSMGLVVTFGGGTHRAAVVNLPAEAKLDAAACAWWAKVLRNYPVSCSEVVLKRPDGRQECRLKYNYYRLGDPNDPAITVAPVPMLASFALEHKYPGLEVTGAKETGYRSQHAAYRVVEGADTLTYIAPAVDRTKVMKGVGELFAKRDEKSNSHAMGDELGMFRRMANWGFDHCRYALAFNADWDLPLVPRGAVSDDEQLWKRLDELIARCNQAGVQMMLCWFPEIESRRWRDRPQEPKTIFEFWRRVARRYKDLPDWAISYDFFNEPAYMNADHWNQVMKELTAIVRAEDKRHMLVWESADGWAQPHWCLWMEPVRDDNVLYSFHHYGKHWGYAYDEYYPGYQCTHERTHIDPWLEAILFGLKHHVPIHCGEFGISMIQPAGDGEQWLEDYLAFFERFGIGWNWWNYSGDDIYRTGLIARGRVSPYVPILTKWARRSGWGQSRR